MGIYDRDYTKSQRRPGEGVAWRTYLPPRGTLALIVMHVLAFALLRAAARSAAAQMLVLQGSVSHPAAIVLHPLALRSIWTLIFVGWAIWTLGGLIESRFGSGRLLLVYALGTIIAGAVYFGFGQAAPDLAAYPLAVPAGALAAWALAAWRNLSYEMVSVFGRLITCAKATAIGALVVAGWVFFRQGPAATGWLLAAAAGSLAWPAVDLLSRAAGRRTSRYSEPPRASPRRPRRTERDAPGEEHPIDDILAKISRAGMDSLTRKERKRLEAARKAKLRQSR